MGKLRKAGVWRDEDVREWADVKEQARREGRDVHIGSLHELLVEKGSELPEGDEKRKFKGRVVFLGDQVKDREGNYALFEELSSSPCSHECQQIGRPLWQPTRLCHRNRRRGPGLSTSQNGQPCKNMGQTAQRPMA